MKFQHFTDNQIIPLIISGVILIGSILYYHTGKTKISLALLFFGTLGLGYFIANLDHFLILWDEQYHALVAKNLASNPLTPTLYSIPLLEYDYKNWTGNHIWLHKQPLFLWQIALSLKLFGYNALAVRLPSIILHAITALMIFRIGKISTSERVGFYGALFFAVAYYPLELIAGRYSTDHNDISFLFYVTASFWAWFEYQHSQNKYYLILIGLFSGCAVLVKWLVGLLIYASWILTIGIKDKRNWVKIKSYLPIIISFSISLIIFIPWQVYIILKFPVEANHEFNYNSKHFFEVIENHGGNIWFHFHALKNIYGSGDAVPYLLLIGLIIFLKKTSSNIYRVAIISAITITYTFYTIAATKMTSFCMIVSPFVFLGLASFIDTIMTFISNKIKSNKIEFALSSIVIIVICSFLINLTKIQNYHTDWKPHDNCNRKAELNQMVFIDKLITTLGDDNYVVFNTNVRVNGNISVMFYTDYIAYDFIPNEKQIAQVESKKYKIAILDNDSLPNYIKYNNDIVKINMRY